MAAIILRPVGPGDEAEFLKAAVASAGLLEPWVYLPETPAQFTDYLARFDGVGGVGFVVCLEADGSIVGFVNINQIFRRSLERGILGFGAFEAGHARGIMSEAVRRTVAYGFGELGLHRLEADIQPANVRSKRLVERLGFRCEGLSPAYLRINGVWRDHERWAITAGNG
ncbi:GNAT family protein [Actinocorallia longicatena]|uniref:GNAT family protein n=1 Tax=Actinocorallia longicatena TaxID=111803 RepID=A0ABP6PZH5_9ACTN